MSGAPMEFGTAGTEQLRLIAQRLNEAADRTLTNSVRRSMRDVAKPIGEEVVHEAAQSMPKRNGFAARVRDATRIGVQSALVAGRTVNVVIAAKNPGSNLSALNRGILRHPVYARGPRSEWTWRRQTVPEAAFTKALERRAGRVRDEVLEAMQETLNDLTKGL